MLSRQRLHFMCSIILFTNLACLTTAAPASDTKGCSAYSDYYKHQTNVTAPKSFFSPTVKLPGSCPPSLVNVVFNGGYSPSMFNQMPGAANWITFGLGQDPGQIPMMAFESDVPAAVAMVNSANPPEYMLTFNEPDYSYNGQSPTMDPATAASAIAPLLASPGPSTKYIAPVTADPTSDWLDKFYGLCHCQGFFHAYNIHVFLPTANQSATDITTFHNKYSNASLWVTEIAPGGAGCGLDMATTVTSYMQDVYTWGAEQSWLERIFWNTGNELNDNDQNVCNSYLLDLNGQPSVLMAPFNSLSCNSSSSRMEGSGLTFDTAADS